MSRGRPARRGATDAPKDPEVEPRQGFFFVRAARTDGDWQERVEQKIHRVVRQGYHEHGQGDVWCVEYEAPRVDDSGTLVTERVLTWIMYDRYRGQWADARLVQDEALARGEPIYAVQPKVPPLGPVP